MRARHRTFISKVILHPNKVCELQIKNEKIATRAGQYVFLNCPEVSYWQWHPFTLTSAPEEDYISVHIRIVGDFTTSLAEALGCDLGRPAEKGEIGAEVVQPPLNRVLPRVMVSPAGLSRLMGTTETDVEVTWVRLTARSGQRLRMCSSTR